MRTYPLSQIEKKSTAPKDRSFRKGEPIRIGSDSQARQNLLDMGIPAKLIGRNGFISQVGLNGVAFFVAGIGAPTAGVKEYHLPHDRVHKTLQHREGDYFFLEQAA